MKQVRQEILCILLQRLLDQSLITQAIYEQSRDAILAGLDLPDFFRPSKEEAPDGGA